MTAKIFIASCTIAAGSGSTGTGINTPFEHLFLVYDPDGNPNTTTEQKYIEGLSESITGIIPSGNLMVIADDTLAGTAKELDTSTPLDGVADVDPYTVYNHHTMRGIC